MVQVTCRRAVHLAMEQHTDVAQGHETYELGRGVQPGEVQQEPGRGEKVRWRNHEKIG